MPLPIITDVFRCALGYRSTDNSLQAINVIHVIDGAHTALEVGEAVNAAVSDHNWWDAVSSDINYKGVTVTPLDGAGTSVFVDGDGTATGSAGGQPMPAVCQTITLYTDARGRSFRGRIFTPFVSESVFAAGIIDPGTTVETHTDFESFMGELGTSTGGLVVASYKHSTSHLVTSFTVQGIASTQRRRQSRLR